METPNPVLSLKSWKSWELLSLWNLSLWVTDVIQVKVISGLRITSIWGWVCAPLKRVASLSQFPFRQGWQAPSQLTIRSQLTIFWFSLMWKDWISDPLGLWISSTWRDQSLQVRVEQNSSSFKNANHFSCVEKMKFFFSKAICLYCVHEDYTRERGIYVTVQSSCY